MRNRTYLKLPINPLVTEVLPLTPITTRSRKVIHKLLVPKGTGLLHQLQRTIGT